VTTSRRTLVAVASIFVVLNVPHWASALNCARPFTWLVMEPIT